MSNPLFSGKHTEHVHIKPYSVIVVDYHDTQPNFFKIFNNSDSEILCATSQYPTPKAYDFKVKAHAVKGYADIYNRSRLYVYNTSGSEADLTIHSFSGVFDPSAYFLSDFEFTVDTEAETHVNVTGFSQPLPAGSNKIGTVGISGAIPAGSNNIGKVSVTSLPALPAGSNKIGTVSVDNHNDYASVLANILTAIGNIKVDIPEEKHPRTRSGMTTDDDFTMEASDDTVINEIVFFSNDGENTYYELIITHYDGGSTANMFIKPGEVLNNIKVYAKSFQVKAHGDGVGTDSCRYCYNELAV